MQRFAHIWRALDDFRFRALLHSATCVVLPRASTAPPTKPRTPVTIGFIAACGLIPYRNHKEFVLYVVPANSLKSSMTQKLLLIKKLFL